MTGKDKQSVQSGNSRRRFLKNAAIAASGIIIVPRHVLGGRGFIAPSDKLQIAAIGIGGKGAGDIKSFYSGGKCEIAFLCDVDEVRGAQTRTQYSKAQFYKDYREMLDKEHKHIDAVSVSTPDHNHAVQALAAMQLGKHVYVQKPLTHDIYEARMLTKAAHKYKVVTQMGNQGASGDGVRQLQEWYNAGLIGDVHTVYCFTDRPVWPQGISWPATRAAVPATLDWNLWLGTAPYTEYIDKLVPFNWRGWWEYGAGALGDMGCHIIAPPFTVLGLGYPTEAECSVGSVYVDEFKRGYFPESIPPSSHVILKFKGSNGKPDIKLHWMDGGIQPERPDELGPKELLGEGGNAALFIGTKGKMMCGTYGRNPQLLPTSRTNEVKLEKTIPRVKDAEAGHYTRWVEAAMAGYGSKEAKELSANFDIAGPLTETVLMGNLAIRSFDLRRKSSTNPDKWEYPGRYIKLLWDGDEMRVTNFDEANQFVKRNYRDGFSLVS